MTRSTSSTKTRVWLTPAFLRQVEWRSRDNAKTYSAVATFAGYCSRHHAGIILHGEDGEYLYPSRHGIEREPAPDGDTFIPWRYVLMVSP